MKTEEMLDFLGCLFENCFEGPVDECDNTFSRTDEYIEEYFSYPDSQKNAVEDSKAVKLWLHEHGACCCDCEIAMNILGTQQGLLAQLWHMSHNEPPNNTIPSAKAVLIEKLFDFAETDRLKSSQKMSP